MWAGAGGLSGVIGEEGRGRRQPNIRGVGRGEGLAPGGEVTVALRLALGTGTVPLMGPGWEGKEVRTPATPWATRQALGGVG